jgi:hypothetical protein
MRDSDGKLAGWDLPRNHFAIEEIPEELKYPQSYQATFGGTPGTAHMTGEGVVFVYFNYGSKTFERLKIKPAHTHIFIQTEKRPLFLLKDQIPFYLRIGSAINTWDAHADSPASTINDNAGCLNPC